MHSIKNYIDGAFGMQNGGMEINQNWKRKNNDEVVIYIRPLLNALLRRLWLIALSGVLAGVVVFGALKVFVKPTYRAGFTAYINNRDGQTVNEPLTNSDISASKALVNTYSAIITSPTILEEAAIQADIQCPFSELQKIVSTSIVDDTELVEVYAVMEEREDAYRLATAISEIAPTYVARIVEGSSMKVLDAPKLPTTEFGPDYFKYTGMAVILTLIAVAIIIVIIEIKKDPVPAADSLEERFGLPVFARIPDMGTTESVQNNLEKRSMKGKEQREKCVARLTENSSFLSQEAYRLLRTNVMFSLPQENATAIGVVSSQKNEGKSTTTLNLGISFAQLGRKVLIVEADMRLPVISTQLDVAQDAGLSDILTGYKPVKDALKTVPHEKFHIIPAGNVSFDPTRLLASKQMKMLLESLKKYYDVILVDLPPVNEVADAAILADKLDGYLLVVRHNIASNKGISSMMSQLRMAKGELLGFVYNMAPNSSPHYYYYE